MELAKPEGGRRLRDVLRCSAFRYYCFHDADVRPEGKSFAESAARLDEIADYFQGRR